MERRALLKGIAGLAVLPVVSACGGGGAKRSSPSTTVGSSASASGAQALDFDGSKYTVETTTVSTSSGTKTVMYHFYRALPYVTRPVDTTYQSLDVAVPVKIDGKDVNAAGAPILLNINVAGYTSSPVPSSFDGGGGISSANGFTGSPPGGGAPGGSGSEGGPPGGTPPSGGASGSAPGGGQSVGNAELALPPAG